MKFEIVINQNGAYFFRLIADNGNILASSEAYSSKTKCVQTVRAISKEFSLQYDPRGLTAEISYE